MFPAESSVGQMAAHLALEEAVPLCRAMAGVVLKPVPFIFTKAGVYCMCLQSLWGSASGKGIDLVVEPGALFALGYLRRIR